MSDREDALSLIKEAVERGGTVSLIRPSNPMVAIEQMLCSNVYEYAQRLLDEPDKSDLVLRSDHALRDETLRLDTRWRLLATLLSRHSVDLSELKSTLQNERARKYSSIDQEYTNVLLAIYDAGGWADLT